MCYPISFTQVILDPNGCDGGFEDERELQRGDSRETWQVAVEIQFNRCSRDRRLKHNYGPVCVLETLII